MYTYVWVCRGTQGRETGAYALSDQNHLWAQRGFRTSPSHVKINHFC